METEVKTGWFIGMEIEDGYTLFYNEQQRYWSQWRRDATGWLSAEVCKEHLNNNLGRKNIPSCAKVIEIRTTIEEINTKSEGSLSIPNDWAYIG
jgi:hypothetical protein